MAERGLRGYLAFGKLELVSKDANGFSILKKKREILNFVTGFSRDSCNTYRMGAVVVLGL